MIAPIVSVLAMLNVSFTAAATEAQLPPATLQQMIDDANALRLTVQQRGQRSDTQVSAEVQVELKGIASKLATAGGRASVGAASGAYEGVPTQDLPALLIRSQDCRLDAFRMISRVVGLPLPAIPAEIQSVGKPLPIFVDARMTESATLYLSDGQGTFAQWRHTLGLFKCACQAEAIVCLLGLTRPEKGDSDYKYDEIELSRTIFVDNFGISHKQTGGDFTNGKNQHKQIINADSGLDVRLAQEFEDPLSDITTGRIVLPDHRAIFHGTVANEIAQAR